MVPPTRHLLRARDAIDTRYREPLDIPQLAKIAHSSQAHFIREFRRAFGATPHQYLLTRRMERAAALLTRTDHTVLEICLEVGLRSVGSFTTSFRRTYGVTPTEYRAAYPPGDGYIPTCYWMTAARPAGRAVLEKTRPEGALTVADGHS
jgi:AraC-like DNA-binding protein